MTRHYYIICFLVLGIVSNVFCQNKDPRIVRYEELAELDQVLRGISHQQCRESINKAGDEINKYIVNTQFSPEYVDRILGNFMDNIIPEPPIDVSQFPSTRGGHVVACDREIAERVVSFSCQLAREASDYETRQALSKLNLG